MKEVDRLWREPNLTKRKVIFLSMLTREVMRRGGVPPVIVGGEALEIYTQGRYTSGDIDLLGPRDLIREVLTSWGFEERGRLLVHRMLDLWVDLQGEGPGAQRIVRVEVAPGEYVHVLSVEDLIVDRLAAAKFWKDTDSLRWAAVLLEVGKAVGFDEEYLERRAEAEDVVDALERIRRGPVELTED